MPTPIRVLLSVFAALASFYFVLWVPCALILPSIFPGAIAPLVSLACALVVTRYVWQRTASKPAGVGARAGKYALLGAVITGAAGFCGGFFGPMIFTPEANQGPLLGIFLTGPLGFVLGGVGGAVYGSTRRGKVGAQAPRDPSAG
jgi:hypothetical protein